MDGKNQTELHSTNLQTPYALAIDYESQILYWADYSLNRLESSNTDGSNRRLLTTTNIQSIHAMIFSAENLYWTDWQFNGIHATPSSAPSNATFVLNLGGDPYDIHVVYDEEQPEGILMHFVITFKACLQCILLPSQYIVPNPCATNNSGCSHMCVLSAVEPAGYSCLCPSDYSLTDNKTCERKYRSNLKMFLC